MSNKKNIDSIGEIISKESEILIRDSIELERLQSAEPHVIEKFTIASYRKFTLRIVSKISNLIAPYKVKLPDSISCLYNSVLQDISINSILDTVEIEKIGDKNIGLFLISPLDGIINFTRSIPLFCSSIAIFISEDNQLQPHQALVYEVSLNKFYTATVGQGSFLNGVKLSISNKSKIYTSISAINGLESLIKENPNNENALILCNKIKNVGILSANCFSGIPSQLAACYLAAGKLDILIEANLKDANSIVAGAIIAKECGCYIFNQHGLEITIDEIINKKEKIIIMTNRNVAEAIKKIFQ